METPAVEQDIHDIAMSLPEVTRLTHAGDLPVYQVKRKSFVFFRGARPDAVDPETGERLTDVVCFFVPDEHEKRALVDGDGPFFTTPHFDGHASVLLRLSELHRISRDELSEIITDGWLCRAPKRLAARWLAEHSQ
ncbi:MULTISPECIES: MmcQ/YjbR family DNA-binding protein [unclassified Nocardia]|uniref:MmcQ/YjbR family DNA-binding protein n=1 Tax=unclassified Nocardia TaxID=2637762 RepID=UPI001CE46AED|nr:MULTISPECIES: hypothetical protein [unclassified Nocardia]